MCGVFGYVGQTIPIIPVVTNALRVMEYRGYDSWGVGWDAGSRIGLIKETGRVPHRISHEAAASIAIGHTRWATHGGVTQSNTHPHTDESDQIAVFHNGVIENADALKAEFLDGVSFRSETDSEIVPHLIRAFINEGDTFAEAVRRSFLLLEGNSAIVAMDRHSEMLVAITARSPLRVGRRTDGWEIASDPLACAATSSEIAVIPDHHLLILTRDFAQVVDVHQGTDVALVWEPTPTEMQSSRGEHSHFTIKEIHDQPNVLRDLASKRSDAALLADAIRKHRHIVLTGCGSAHYAASLGALWLGDVIDGWIDVVSASEVSASTRNMGSETLLIAFTQSGETADVVDAVQVAREWGATVGAVINTESSTIARMADVVLPIHAGVERSVLATKSFLAMAVRMYQVSAILGRSDDKSIEALIPAIETILADESISRIARDIAESESMIVLGKGPGRAIAQEAALKIKEGSYLHAEAFLLGELKHGPLALVQDGTPCVIFATSEDEMVSARIAAAEVASRGGKVIGIGPWQEHECAHRVVIPAVSDLVPLIHLVAAQVLAYHVSIERGVDPDFPRNLAKSVTVG